MIVRSMHLYLEDQGVVTLSLQCFLREWQNCIGRDIPCARAGAIMVQVYRAETPLLGVKGVEEVSVGLVAILFLGLVANRKICRL